MNTITAPTAEISLDLRVKPVEGKFPVCVKVTFTEIRKKGKHWNRQYYRHPSLKPYLTREEFDQMMDKPRHENLKDIKKAFVKLERKASDYIEKYNCITQTKFELYFLSNHKPESLAGQFEIKIKELKDAKPRPKISSAENYENAIKSFEAFFGKDVSFHDCTAERLQEYEDDYVLKGGSLATVGIYMRSLRHIFNRAIKTGIIPVTLYPFGEGDDQYCIPEGDGDEVKDFLDTDEKNQFLTHKFSGWRCDNPNCGRFIRKESKKFPKCSMCRRGTLHPCEDLTYSELHDYASLIYFAHGLNPADIFRLRKTQFKVDHFTLTNREKTKSKKKKKIKTYTVPLPKEAVAIVKRRESKVIGVDDPYLFPILNDQMTEEEKFKAVRAMVRELNRMLEYLYKIYNWSVKPTVYVLRHTFSDQYMQAGATTEELQFALIHQSKRTTETYKHGFRLKSQRKLSESLGA